MITDCNILYSNKFVSFADLSKLISILPQTDCLTWFSLRQTADWFKGNKITVTLPSPDTFSPHVTVASVVCQWWPIKCGVALFVFLGGGFFSHLVTTLMNKKIILFKQYLIQFAFFFFFFVKHLVACELTQSLMIESHTQNPFGSGLVCMRWLVETYLTSAVVVSFRKVSFSAVWCCLRLTSYIKVPDLSSIFLG